VRNAPCAGEITSPIVVPRHSSDSSKKPLPQVREAFELWQQARWRKAEALLTSVPREQLSDEARLLLTRLVGYRDPAAGVALATSMLAARHGTRFTSEVLAVLGSGLSRVGAFAEAEERFAEAERGAGGDRDLLAKIALNRAVSLMLQGRVPEIEPLLTTIRASSDPGVRAQAEEMYAVLLRHREQYRQQIPVLLRALFELRPARPVNLWARCSILHMLSEIVVEYWEPTLATIVEEEFNAIEWHEEVADWHFFISRALSWWYALSGDSLGAFRYLKRAVSFPVRDALRALNHADRAYLARAQGEMAWSDQELSEATDLARRVAWELESDARDDASIALASLAELYAPIDVERSSEYLARFQSFRRQMSSANTRRHDRTDEAFVGSVKGIVTAAFGKLGEATRTLGESYETYDAIGYDWRAGKVALALASVTSDPHYLELARIKLARYPQSWLAADYRRQASHLGFTDALPGVHLTPAQWRVFRLLADDYSLREVASHLGRSVNTVRNHVVAIYAELGVHTRAELRALARKLEGSKTVA
jgi:DNA-binding CsgD family transcriptional regulator